MIDTLLKFVFGVKYNHLDCKYFFERKDATLLRHEEKLLSDFAT